MDLRTEDLYIKHEGMYLVNKFKHPLFILSLLAIFFSSSCGMNDIDTAEFATSSYGIVQYPVFENIEGTEQINDLIRNKAESLADINLESKFSGIIDYSVLECNSEVISIEFYGDIVYLPTRKPARIYSCMSIDVKKKEQIKLNDIVEIDENFIEDYMEKLWLKYKDLHPEADHNPFSGEDGTYSLKYLEYFLNKADELVYDDNYDKPYDSKIKSCIHENNLILSMELPQANGYHIEVEMPIDDISQTNT